MVSSNQQEIIIKSDEISWFFFAVFNNEEKLLKILSASIKTLKIS